MSRTYIGPFGRILPILDGHEPEQQQFPIDETRTNMTTYQLPPPERLQFGSDTSPGFTEPIRYNTISQSRRSPKTISPVCSEQSGPPPYEQLPPVRQLFLPTSSNTQASQYPTQHDAHLLQRNTNMHSAHQSLPNQPNLVPQYPYQGSFPQPALPLHIQSSASINVQKGDLGNNLPNLQPASSQHTLNHSLSGASYPLPYAVYHERSPSVHYSVAQHAQQAPAPNPSEARQTPALDTNQPHEANAISAAAPYFQETTGIYDISSIPVAGYQKSQQTTENSIRPMARVVGDADVPGQGPSWVYEDGTTCKKIIDGEEVNAQWGVTKAGKPRKRLAIACTTCREKKIKCDPAEPKCVQCEKFGRECRFTTA